jgi:hypothetical protein
VCYDGYACYDDDHLQPVFPVLADPVPLGEDALENAQQGAHSLDYHQDLANQTNVLFENHQG